MKWYRVEDKLPDFNEVVLIYVNYYSETGINVARFCKDEVRDNNKKPYSWYATGGPMHWFGQHVTHWAKLPNAPEELEDNNAT